MQPGLKNNGGRRENTLVVDWRNCAWVPPITVTKPLLPLPPVLHTIRRNLTFLKTMKIISHSSRRLRAGFTLVELLVVIAIIGILAAMSLAVIPRVVNSAKRTKAKLEAQDIATAIQHYASVYGRFPASSGSQTVGGVNDFTYGGSVLANASFSPVYTTNNAEVIAILMDSQTFGNGVNTNHVKNPQKTIFLNAKMTDYPTVLLTPPPGGVDQNGVYRDPWGNPYIITMDLSYDEQSKDAFYSQTSVSGGGLNGLVNPDGSANNFRFHGTVMVWSAGPDGKVDPNALANQGLNKDNVLSW